MLAFAFVPRVRADLFVCLVAIVAVAIARTSVVTYASMPGTIRIARLSVRRWWQLGAIALLA